MAVEHAPKSKRGLFGASPQIGVPLGLRPAQLGTEPAQVRPESPGLEEGVLDGVGATDRIGGTVSDTELDRMRAHFTTTSRYEWMFWDGAYRQETWPV